MEPLEEQLDLLLEESRQKRRSKIAELNTAFVQRVRVDVDDIVKRVQSSLMSEQPEVELQVKRLLRMTEELATGVDMWQQKALDSIEAIAREQKALGTMLQEVSLRTTAERESLMKRQQQRVEGVRMACLERLKGVELKL